MNDIIMYLSPSFLAAMPKLVVSAPKKMLLKYGRQVLDILFKTSNKGCALHSNHLCELGPFLLLLRYLIPAPCGCLMNVE
jgi:hypothetical protein